MSDLLTVGFGQEVMVHSEASHEWVVVNATQTRKDAIINPSFHFSRLEVRLTLRRNKAVHVLTVGVPTLGRHIL